MSLRHSQSNEFGIPASAAIGRKSNCDWVGELAYHALPFDRLPEPQPPYIPDGRTCPGKFDCVREDWPEFDQVVSLEALKSSCPAPRSDSEEKNTTTCSKVFAAHEKHFPCR
jgi:hypothetical protein